VFVLIGTILTVFVSQLVTVAALAVLGFHVGVGGGRHLSPPAQLAAAAIGDAAVALYLLAVLPFLAKRPLSALGFRTPKLRDIRIGLLGGFALIAISDTLAGIMQTLTHATHPEAALALLKGLHGPWQIGAFVVLACVLAPITEELVFRVFLFNAIDRYGKFWPAAIFSGLIFGLVHVSSSALDVLVFALPLAIGGIILAIVYARSGCYWSNVIAHASFNSVAVIAVLAFHASV
jgi:membrane protease YdiL (CAAX protease family)